MPISEELKNIVVCPKCRGELDYDQQGDWFDCNHCKLRYFVVDGIVNFLIESAEEIKEND